MLHPDSNNLANFLGASLSSFSRLPSSSLKFLRLPLPPPTPTHFLPFSQTELLLTSRCNFQFAESFLVLSSRSDPFKFCTSGVSHCFWKTDVPEPPTASHSMQSEHLAALNDLNFQLFGGSELCHQPQTGSGEPVGCQLNPTLRLREYNHNL